MRNPPRSTGTTEQGAGAQATQTQAGGSAGEQAANTAKAGSEVAVSDLTGREVTTPQGEEIGKIDRFVVIDGEPKVIFKRGGFFGIGSKDVAVPAAQLAMQGDQLILNGVSTDAFEAMPVLESNSGSELAADDTVRIGAAQ